MDALSALTDTTLRIEKARVALQVRLSHLKLKGKQDALTEEALGKVDDLEKWIDKRIATLIQTHPAYPWFSKVKGVGGENIAKVLCSVRVKPERGFDQDGNEIDLPFADSISALWKFAGYAPVDGHAMKRTSGEKLAYNSQLRSMCWRLGSSLLKANSNFKAYYDAQKQRYIERYTMAGVKVIPAAQLPKVGGKKQETEGLISEGHVHNQALRKMVKLFLACLWLEWRKMEGLSVREPYAIGIQGHTTMIDPWKMTDR